MDSKDAHANRPVFDEDVADIGESRVLGMHLLLTRPERAYSLVLLFFGIFVTMGTSVTAIGLVVWFNHDPEAQAGALVIYPLLTIMAWAGLLYLIKDKLPRSHRTRSSSGSASP